MANINGTFNSLIGGTISGQVGTPGPQGPAGPAGAQGIPGVGVPVGGLTGQFLSKASNTSYDTAWTTLSLAGYATESWVTAGFYPLVGNPSGFLTASALTPYLTKADNLGSLTSFSTARDNLSLGTLNSPTFAGVTAQGSGANVANLTPTSLSLSHATSGTFTIQPSVGITFPDLSVQSTAFNLSVLSPYALINSQAFTGTPSMPTGTTAVTQPTLTSTTSLATTAFVQQELAAGTANARNLEVLVRNQSGSTIPAGSIVYISGATGNLPLITLAQGNNDANSAQTMGFVKTAIANNGTGFVIVRGELENIDTSALTEGVQLYLSPTTAGTWTTTKPSAPQHLVYVGIVVRAHPTQGTILVAVQNGYELDELHDVLITTPTNGQVLSYDSVSGLWKNSAASGGAVWGGITGTLSSQLDLVSALDLKANLSGATFTGKANFTPVSGVAGLNVGIGGTSAASTTAGDMWIAAGGVNLNFRDGTGAWRVCAVTTSTNSFSSPQVIDTTATTPALRVTQKGTGLAIRVEDSTTPDVTAFFVGADGKTAIAKDPATVSPTSDLEVGSTNNPGSDGTILAGSYVATGTEGFTVLTSSSVYFEENGVYFNVVSIDTTSNLLRLRINGSEYDVSISPVSP